MGATRLPLVVRCSVVKTANPPLQPDVAPTLELTLETQDGQRYLLPLTEAGSATLFEVISNWRQLQEFLPEFE